MWKPVAFTVGVHVAVAYLLSSSVPTALVCQAILWGFVYLYAVYPQTRLSWLPSAPAKLFSGHMKFLMSWDDALKMAREYGPVFKMLMGRTPYVVVTDAECLKEVLSDNFHTDFHSRPEFNDFGLFTGEHLFTQPYDKWKSSRRAITPAFNTLNLTKFATVISEAGEEFCVRLKEASQSQKECEMWRMYGSVTLQVISATSFGESIRYSDKLGSELAKAMGSLFRPADEKRQAAGMSLMSMFPFLGHLLSLLPIGELRQKLECRGLVDATTSSMIKKMKEGNISDEKKRSFLNLLINAVDSKTGKKMPEKELIDQSFLFMFAGYETTANTLSFATHNITKYPEIQNKLLEEIDAHYPKNGEVTYQDLKNFTYLDMVIQETLRLYPPLSIVSLIRKAAKDTTIKGYRIPKGTHITMPQFILHRDPKLYPEPETFRPERWDPLSEESQNRHRFAWVPFGEGPRKCVGYRFALEELKIILIKVFKNFTFVMGPKSANPIKLSYPFGSLSPSGGLFLIPKAR